MGDEVRWLAQDFVGHQQDCDFESKCVESHRHVLSRGVTFRLLGEEWNTEQKAGRRKRNSGDC